MISDLEMALLNAFHVDVVHLLCQQFLKIFSLPPPLGFTRMISSMMFWFLYYFCNLLYHIEPKRRKLFYADERNRLSQVPCSEIYNFYIRSAH